MWRKWPEEIDCRLLFGTRDLRRQVDADRYLEKLWKARVRVRESRNVIFFPSPIALLRRQAS